MTTLSKIIFTVAILATFLVTDVSAHIVPSATHIYTINATPQKTDFTLKYYFEPGLALTISSYLDNNHDGTIDPEMKTLWGKTFI